MQTLATHELQYVSGASQPGWGVTIGSIVGGFTRSPWGVAAGAAIGHGIETTDWDAVARNRINSVAKDIKNGNIPAD
ncbi:hypothetical protein [Neisseria sp.]|uniref:hypothetical protein n=1 Tax=Neisseria sp. TaxID=192066 RepID=UPI0026DB8B95|nr:hypothetical protein [Neisseria sp.]MDO4906859.1 hypothetical protein [Neisseria sp.]